MANPKMIDVLVRLGAENPKMRPHIRPILAAAKIDREQLLRDLKDFYRDVSHRGYERKSDELFRAGDPNPHDTVVAEIDQRFQSLGQRVQELVSKSPSVVPYSSFLPKYLQVLDRMDRSRVFFLREYLNALANNIIKIMNMVKAVPDTLAMTPPQAEVLLQSVLFDSTHGKNRLLGIRLGEAFRNVPESILVALQEDWEDFTDRNEATKNQDESYGEAAKEKVQDLLRRFILPALRRL